MEIGIHTFASANFKDEEGKQIYDKKLDDWISNPNYRFNEFLKKIFRIYLEK